MMKLFGKKKDEKVEAFLSNFSEMDFQKVATVAAQAEWLMRDLSTDEAAAALAVSALIQGFRLHGDKTGDQFVKENLLPSLGILTYLSDSGQVDIKALADLSPVMELEE